MIESDVVDFLHTFCLLENEVARNIEFLSASDTGQDNAECPRKEIGTRLGRIAELYKWDDSTRDA